MKTLFESEGHRNKAHLTSTGTLAPGFGGLRQGLGGSEYRVAKWYCSRTHYNQATYWIKNMLWLGV
jgi:hypothetical protein